MSPPWWKDKWGSDKICPITLKRLRPGKNKYGFNYVIKLSCNHCFYRMAIIKWYCNQILLKSVFSCICFANANLTMITFELFPIS